MNTLVLVAWMYVAANGTVSYTDDAKNIPTRYVASAKQIEIGPLAEYPRLTIDQTLAAKEQR